MKRLSVLAAALFLVALGCGEAKYSQYAAMDAGEAAPMAKAPAPGQPAAAQAADAKPMPRKIIYNAKATLVVETFDGVEKKLEQAIEAHKGTYVAKSDVTGSPGSRRSGTWTIRIPSEQLDAFMNEVAEIGELQQRTLESDDITDRFYDLENRIKNLKVREEGLRKLLLEKSSSKLEDLLAVDRELSRVREEIEVSQGQLKRWSQLTEFATLVLSVRERKDYVPPTSPSFGKNISRTFGGSLDALTNFLQGIVLVLVALVPWIPVMALIVVPIWYVIRRSLRSPAPMTVLPAEPQAPPPAV
jgi:hypothetical protein